MQVQAEVSGPSGPVQVEFDPREGKGQFTAREHGMHEVLVTNEGEAVKVDIYNIYSIYNIYNISSVGQRLGGVRQGGELLYRDHPH